MEKTKKYRFFWYPFYAVLVLFIGLTIALETGYYEASINDKVTFTEEQIKIFEEDVKAGKTIDIKEYLTDDFVDYSNSVSRLGQSISNGLGNVLTNGIGKLFGIVGSLIS